MKTNFDQQRETFRNDPFNNNLMKIKRSLSEKEQEKMALTLNAAFKYILKQFL